MVMQLSGGRVPDEKQATYILLGFAVVMLTAAVGLLVTTFRTPTPAIPHSVIAGPGDPAYHSQ